MNMIKTALVLAPLALAACQEPMRTMPVPDTGASPAARSGSGAPSATPSTAGNPSGSMSGSSMGTSVPSGTGRQQGSSTR
jgi:hypothetical protein